MIAKNQMAIDIISRMPEYYGYITTGIYPLKGIVGENGVEHRFPITN